MKTTILFAIAILILLCNPQGYMAQAPTMGTVSNYVLFSADGSVTNSGISQLTGNVGTNNGSSTGFGNVNGVMHDGDPSSIQCAADLLVVYNQLAVPMVGACASNPEGLHNKINIAIAKSIVVFIIF